MQVVLIGGGHGLATMAKGLKTMKDMEVTAIVTVADNGGSTGRLRKEYKLPGMGDIRDVLLALAKNENTFYDLMDYRFNDPNNRQEDVLGHSLGNLILTALIDTTGSFQEAINCVCKQIGVEGKIIPSTNQIVQIAAVMRDGKTVVGESNIPEQKSQVFSVFYEEEVHGNKEAVEAILNADIVLYGIGSLYTSIIPNVIIPEIKEALQQTNALRLYCCNAMEQPGETTNYSCEDHVNALRKHGAAIDGVLIASDEIPANIRYRYLKEGADIVTLKQKEHDYAIYKYPLLKIKDDKVRHDPLKIAQAIQAIEKKKVI